MGASPSGQIEGHAEGTAEFGEFSGGEGSDIVGEVGFRRLTRLSHMIQLSCFMPSPGRLRSAWRGLSGGENGGADHG